MVIKLLILLAILLISVAIGGPIATCMGFTAVSATLLWLGPKYLLTLGTVIYKSAISTDNMLIPMFVLMAELITRGGIAEDIYYVLAKLLRKVRAGLAMATILACTVFAALCGSSPATAATIGVISYKEMVKRGYRPDFAIGCPAGGGTLGVMIPPSITLIMYGSLTGTSIVKLLMAGLLPGLMLAALMCVMCVVRASINPTLVGAPARHKRLVGSNLSSELSAPEADCYEEEFNTTFWQDIVKAGPAILLIAILLVCMYTGVATAQECAGIGVVVSFILVVLKGKLTRELIENAAVRTIRVSSAMILILAASACLTNVISRIGVASAMAEVIGTWEVNRWIIMGAMIVLWFFLGCIMNVTAMISLTIPFVFAPLTALGFDPIWLGIVSTICVEVAAITPPVGNNLFTLKLNVGVEMGTIIKGAMPYVLVLALGILILCFFPSIATFIPNMMT